jgi:hypothetical protein
LFRRSAALNLFILSSFLWIPAIIVAGKTSLETIETAPSFCLFLVGVIILFISKIGRFRQGVYDEFGPQNLTNKAKYYYWLGYFLIAGSFIWLLLGSFILKSVLEL